MFAEYLKRIKSETVETRIVPYCEIKCQYNPDRFNAWKSVVGKTLDIDKSPHWYFLNGNYYPYERLQKLYGRNDVWVINKVLKFEKLIDDILQNGIKDPPIVLESPIVENEYNDGLEIWEGHHRLAIASYYRLETKVNICRIV